MKILQYLAIYFKSAKDAIWSMPRHNSFEVSGYLAFLTLTAIFPCSIFLAKLAGFLNNFLSVKFGEDSIANFLIKSFDELTDLPIESLKEEIKSILRGPPKSLVNFAFIGLIWVSSSTIEGLRSILNRAYQIERATPYILGRLFSIVQFLMISIFTIFLISLLHIILPIILYYGENIKFIISEKYFGYFIWLKYTMNISILLLYVLWLHFSLPSHQEKIRDLFPGAVITVFLWLASSKILKFYFTQFLQFNVMYGGLANIVSILLFCYVIFLCFIFGAEFNYFYKKNQYSADEI